MVCDVILQVVYNRLRRLVPQLLDSGLQFLMSVIKNDASLKYSMHGYIRYSE